MERVIKFRSWDSRRDEMLPDATTKELLKNQAIFDNKIAQYGTDYTGWIYFMQYTGLNDANGKEIYEGDIIKRIDTGDTQLIVWKNDCYLARTIYDAWLKRNTLNKEKDVSLYSMTFFKIEVIGNVYENINP